MGWLVCQILAPVKPQARVKSLGSKCTRSCFQGLHLARTQSQCLLGAAQVSPIHRYNPGFHPIHYVWQALIPNRPMLIGCFSMRVSVTKLASGLYIKLQPTCNCAKQQSTNAAEVDSCAASAWVLTILDPDPAPCWPAGATEGACLCPDSQTSGALLFSKKQIWN